jgi:acyl-homoserine-lactone acylase
MEEARVPVDAPLGDVQRADSNGTFVPIHGGNGADGTTNVVGFGRGWSIMDPALEDFDVEYVTDPSYLADYTAPGGEEHTGYLINNGTSFLFALAYDDAGPHAKAFLTYGDTEDRDDPRYRAATEAFGEQAWRDVAFTEEAVAAATETEVRVQG